LRILVTGAQGMLGTDVCAVLSEGHEVDGVDVGDFDITSWPDAARAVMERSPEAVVHLAAFTRVDDAEDMKDEAFRSNALGTMNMAKASREVGARLVYLSTDYVFDGTKNSPYLETDPVSPVNFYGLTKLFGEKYASSLNPRHLIIRTSWLFGPNGRNFVDTIIEAARSGRPLRVVDDQRGSPTYTSHLAGGIREALETGLEGVVHMTNSGNTTWFEFARAALETAGVKADLEAVGTASYPTRARRPANSVLGSIVMEHSGLAPLPGWREALKHHLDRKNASEV
jgi:dTDP-4-dehydrorhamnose reductase